MSEASIAKAGMGERSKVIDTLVLAFGADPVERWLYPQPDRYLASFPLFLNAFGARAFDAETVWKSDNCGAVALWFPPGVEPDGEAIAAVLTTSVHPDKHDDMYLALDQMEKAHPTFPHWYLPLLGVDPAVSGQGLGARLLAHCLTVVDKADLPAYLETPNPRTIPFYRRHGFEVSGKTDAGRCPPITFMLRKAQSSLRDVDAS